MKNLILIFIICVVFFAVEWMDFDDESIEQQIYCENVKMGTWGDFKGIYQDECD